MESPQPKQEIQVQKDQNQEGEKAEIVQNISENQYNTEQQKDDQNEKEKEKINDNIDLDNKLKQLDTQSKDSKNLQIQKQQSVQQTIKQVNSDQKEQDSPPPMNLTLQKHQSENLQIKPIKNPQTQSFGTSNKSQSKMSSSTQKKKLSIKDFEIVSFIGQGAFGEVLRVIKKDNKQEYALKLVDKQFLAREKKQYQVFMEKGVLMCLNHVGLVKLHLTFQDTQNLYFGMDYVGGSTFSRYLKLNFTHLHKSAIQFYIAEIILILEYLHSQGIVHRDLKPENLMLTNDRHIKLIDFGTASIFDHKLCPKGISQAYETSRQKKDQSGEGDEYNKQRKASLVGTPEYVSPELLEEEICENGADLWALGIILYKMYQGKTPFYAQTEYLVFQNIRELNYKPPTKADDEALDLIANWLQRDPQKRLGAGLKGSDNDYSALKKHPFFEGIKWEKLFQQEAPPREIFSPTNSQSGNLDEYKYLQNMSGLNSPFPKSENLINLPSTPQYKAKTVQQQVSNKNVQVMTGKFKKKVANVIFNIYHKKQLFLFSNPPKLFYFDLENKNRTTEILIKKDTQILLEKDDKFIIKDQEKEYLFKKMDEPCKPWVDKIKQLQQEYMSFYEKSKKNSVNLQQSQSSIYNGQQNSSKKSNGSSANMSPQIQSFVNNQSGKKQKQQYYCKSVNNLDQQYEQEQKSQQSPIKKFSTEVDSKNIKQN